MRWKLFKALLKINSFIVLIYYTAIMTYTFYIASGNGGYALVQTNAYGEQFLESLLIPMTLVIAIAGIYFFIADCEAVQQFLHRRN